MEITEMIAQLEQNPEDWGSRCAIAQAYYDAEQYEEAARFISEAPEIPNDEDNVLFAATVLSAVDHDSAHGLIDQLLAENPSSRAYELKAQLYDLSGDEESASACRNALNGDEPVAKAVPVETPEPESAVEIATPKSLRPPGAEDEEEDSPEAAAMAAAAMPATSSGPALTVQPQSEESSVEPAIHHVGDGEAVRAMEAAPTSSEKMGAVTAAIIVHVVLGLLLYLAKVAAPRPNPPQITASAVASSDESSLENKTITKQTQKSAAAVSSSQPVVSSVAFSSFAMPDMPDTMSDLTMVSMSDSDSGFGMSMSGFGDVSNMGAIPAAMRSRCSMSERMKRLRESGGEDRAERAVRKGLEFLTSLQDAEGAVGDNYKVGMTGLTLLAYLGHCETPESPKFGDSVVKATLYLMDRAIKNKGQLNSEGEGGHHQAYEHAIGTYALAELYTMTKESGKEIPRLESVLKKCVETIVEAQDPMGGWSYGYTPNSAKGAEDMSVTGWMIQALKAAHNTGRKFRGVDKALDKAVKEFIPAIQDGQGAFKYRPDNPTGKPTLTGAALLALQIWNSMGSSEYNKGLKYLQSKYKNPSPGGNYYAPYYNTQAFFMHGGEEWEQYNSAFQPKLLDAQNKDGSWTKPTGKHGLDNQIMNTAWAILMLEVYYRYLPTTDKVKDL